MAGMPLGRMLRTLRHATGLTLEALAGRSGVSARTISDIERGRSLEPQVRTIRALADALALTEDDRAALYEASRAGGEQARTDAPPLCLLPPDLPDFVGRADELARLAELLRPGPATVVISGAGGLGKTALAVRAAYVLGDLFPDGLFFADLRGLDEEPLDPAGVRDRLRRALGTEPGDVPAGRRVLIVLDNARDESQLRPLRITGASVLITSRRALTGLAGATHLPIGPLGDDDAAEMLREVIHAGPGADEQLHEVARLCGNFPLALRIAGSRLLTRPGWTLATLIDRLDDSERRLDRLAAGDLQIRTAFQASYDQLGPADQLVFRRLALLPAPDAPVELVAAAAGRPVAEVRDRLGELAEAGLVLTRPGSRAGLHDLVWLFAADRLRAQDSAADVATAARRIAGNSTYG
jgi:transcriptional regulator with XRE-family HTH domain